ncbi:MAG: SDR family oxidoreductase [Leptospira sp.]|nr:SDR family oxidoreductase [Leptospira sp.]
MQDSILIIGISSDIGINLAKLYQEKGYQVYGTARDSSQINTIENTKIFNLDFSKPESISDCAKLILNDGITFSKVIFSIGLLSPIGNFFDLDFDEWQASFAINSLHQLKFLHILRPLLSQGSSVIFFHGGAPNGVLVNYSAYSLAKVTLAKFVEYLDAEDSGVSYFILGTGWVRTKLHNQSIDAGSKAGINFSRTKEFLENDHKGTSFQEIFDCINWFSEKGKKVAGGRNFSIVSDAWGDKSDKSSALVDELILDADMYKLRRYKN